MALDEKYPWRKQILLDLRERNKVQCDAFAQLFKSHGRLFKNCENFRVRNNKLQSEVDRLNSQLDSKGESRGNSGGYYSPEPKNEKVSALEQKIYKLQEELTELHRSKGQNAQQLIDLTSQLKEKEKELAASNDRVKELESKNAELLEANQNLDQKLKDTISGHNCLSDEMQALQLVYAALEERHKILQTDNADLVSRWMDAKLQIAEYMNSENDLFRKRKEEKLQQELKKAADEFVDVGPCFDNIPGVCFVTSVPKRALQTFEAHEGEVNAVVWSPTGRIFATGGSDRKVKLWEVSGNGKCESKGVLTGSNAGVTCVCFDPEATHLLAASNDFACRVWTCADQRLRYTLTGHSGKVLAAKFAVETNRVVSGGNDRILKIWDLRSIACIKSIFVGTTCSDLVMLDGMNLISGHVDGKVRIYDTRAETPKASQTIDLVGKITSLDLSQDKTSILCCCRDDSLKIVDVRFAKIVDTLNAGGFHVGSDCTRAIFSPDGAYAAAGSADGAVYVWDVEKKKLDSTLREHSDAVLACAWNPSGRSLLSSDKHKTVVYWTDI